MKEAVVILAVLAVILALTAVRYRRQIATVLQIWRTVKTMRTQIKQSREPDPAERPVSAGPLVNCAKCGTWVPENRAISLRGGVFYCSAACLETTTNVS
ncbi:MAG TPA: hypothetical protein VFZ23_08230 [Pyrinomonadaceae bacterium]